MFNKKTIKSRVIDAINAKIEKHEQLHRDECQQIDAEAISKKQASADTHVSLVLGNVI